MTRNGQCYGLGPSGVKEREEGTEQSDVEVTVLKKKGKKPLNELVTETKANEFLKFIKHSEYNIVELVFKCRSVLSVVNYHFVLKFIRDKYLLVSNIIHANYCFIISIFLLSLCLMCIFIYVIY